MTTHYLNPHISDKFSSFLNSCLSLLSFIGLVVSVATTSVAYSMAEALLLQKGLEHLMMGAH